MDHENDLLETRLRTAGPILAAAFRGQGFPPNWGIGLARQESQFIPTAINNEGGDKARGGSYGLCMMSLQTARDELKFGGAPDLLLDPHINASLAAHFLRILATRHHLEDLANLASLYNSGRLLAHAPDDTKNIYVPHVLRYAAIYANRQF